MNLKSCDTCPTVLDLAKMKFQEEEPEDLYEDKKVEGWIWDIDAICFKACAPCPTCGIPVLKE